MCNKCLKTKSGKYESHNNTGAKIKTCDGPGKSLISVRCGKKAVYTYNHFDSILYRCEEHRYDSDDIYIKDESRIEEPLLLLSDEELK
jgi:hypothetical protein